MYTDEEVDCELKENLIYLLGYFVASISHDLDEWEAWGYPYVSMCAESLGLDDSMTVKVKENFIGIIGYGYSFLFEELDDGWTHVYSVSYFLEKLSQKLEKWDEETVIRYFLVTLADSACRGNYDARLRVLLSHRICSMFNIPVKAVADLENKAVQSAHIQGEFNTIPPMDLGGAVGSFRAWKVGFAAASGGALMFCAGGVSAPAIVASIVALLGVSGTTSAMAVNMTTLLSSYGISALTSTMTTAGAGLASWKMLHRTEAIREFSLEPLHPPHVHHMSESAIMIDWCPPSPSCGDCGGSAGVGDAGTATKVGVYVLVAGHHCESMDLRELWGCDRYYESEEGGDPSVSPLLEGSDDDSAAEVMSGSVETGWQALSSEPGIFLPRRPPSAARLGEDEETVLQQERSRMDSGGWWKTCVSVDTPVGEPFVLSWDRAELHRLYHAQKTFVRDKSVLMAAEELLKLASPVFGAAALPIAVMERAAELDCPWLVAMDRAEQAGKLLASVLLNNRHVNAQSGTGVVNPSTPESSNNSRPVTLVGYGMGARVIFHCLRELSRDPVNGGRGIVESAVLIGAPVGTHRSEWSAVRGVVAGRLVNCYSTHDWFLALMYRCRSWDVGVAGLQPVYLHPSSSSAAQGAAEEEKNGHTRTSPSPSGILRAVECCSVDNVENINITSLVQSHVDYCESLMYILPAVFSREY